MPLTPESPSFLNYVRGLEDRIRALEQRPVAIGNIVHVDHGTDSSFPRPDAEVVLWRGSGHPDNFLPGDFWYDGTEFD